MVINTAAPSFNTTTGQVGPGTTIRAGTSQQTVYRHAGNERRDTRRQRPIRRNTFAGRRQRARGCDRRCSAQARPRSPVSARRWRPTGGFASIATSILTSVALSGSQNSFTQAFDPITAQVLQAALGFGNSVTTAASAAP